jgi:DNA modification methylase
MQLHLGDCYDVLKTLPDNSVDSIVTDPPYGLSFMGKKWDYDVPDKKIWKQCLRVLKHGGHLLAFGGTRTYHRLVVEIEDAGFIVKDQIQWIYGSGFPKSMNISKAIDKRPNVDLIKFSEALKKRRLELDLSLSEADKLITGGTTMYSFLEGRKNKPLYPPNKEYWEKIKEHFGMEGWENVVENNLKIIGDKEGNYGYQKNGERWKKQSSETEITTMKAKEWDGWGTQLKPANEPICLAQKPISGKTIVENVLEHGTGGLNIDDCRIQTNENLNGGAYSKGDYDTKDTVMKLGTKRLSDEYDQPIGRFPANVIMDEEAGAILDEQAPNVGNMMKATRKKTTTGGTGNSWTTSSKNEGDSNGIFDGLGGASRFFYQAKASKSERSAGLTQNENFHPTVKPVDLMRYLCRLITPPNGTVLDPFMGSGSTGIGAILEGFDFIGIEMDEEYLKIAETRIKAWKKSAGKPKKYRGRHDDVKKETSDILKRVEKVSKWNTSTSLDDW